MQNWIFQSGDFMAASPVMRKNSLQVTHPRAILFELPHSGTFIPSPSFIGQNGCKPKGGSSSGFKSIEIRTSKGDAIRIQGEFTGQEL